MEYEKIKQLMIDMGNSKLTSIDIEFPDGVKIKMEKNASVAATPVVQQVVVEQAVEERAQKEEIKEGNIVKTVVGEDPEFYKHLDALMKK